MIKQAENKIDALVESTFPDFRSNYSDPEYLKNKAILATTNETVDEINEYMYLEMKLNTTVQTHYPNAQILVTMLLYYTLSNI